MASQLAGTIEDDIAPEASLAPRWLVDELLREQQQVTPVERFARWHDAEPADLPAALGPAPDHARHYRDLIPVGLPRTGEQFAFEVDLDACSGCKACVTACHNLNDLEPGETWRAVGLLHGGSTQLPALQHVTTACHHCVDPACLKGCPVDAYDKDPTTGIVRHLDDQCIGCQYCTFMCPYDVPKYSRRLGIVRKCDMCRTRLAVGEAPACVQSCPSSAIRIAIVSRQEAIESAEANSFLPGAPEPGCTLPTTIYKTSRPLPRNMLPADYFAAAPQHAHWPLILMLVLTQMSVGALVAGLWPSGGANIVHAAVALAVGLLGIGASLLHLGRPLYAFRAVIGWRRSWLSREIIAFGLFAALAVAYTLAAAIAVGSEGRTATAVRALGICAAAVGLCGVFCSSMIYAATQRPFWSLPRTAAKFLLTAAVLGLPTVLLVDLAAASAMSDGVTDFADNRHARDLLAAIVAIGVAKLVVDASILASLQLRASTPLKRTALLMTGELCRWTKHRFAWGAGGVALPGLVYFAGLRPDADALSSPQTVACVAAGLIAAFIGELCERYLFFAAVVAPKMPGGAQRMSTTLETNVDSRSSQPAASLARMLRAPDGPLTSELLLEPGRFGLGMVPARLAPDATTEMACGFCSTGCGLTVHSKNGVAVNLTPTPDYPVNLGMACPKGWEALNVLKANDRATMPLARDRNGQLAAVDWPTALALFCTRMKDIQRQHGSHSVAFLSTGQIATEEMALLGSLAKFGMGMLHGDGNTRQCMATSVVSYKQSFGFDAPPYTYADFEESDVIVLIGSNLCIAHPIMWQRVCRNPHQPTIIVVDPRRTETAMAATIHLPLRPKSDLVLLYGLAHVLIREEWVDSKFIAAHTSGFDDFAAHVAEYSPTRAAAETGIDELTLLRVARAIGEGRRVSLWWTMGVNQSYEGVRTAQAIINLALMTGNIGRPGTGANSITGQCNAMGSRLFSNTTNLLGGHDFAKLEHRAKVAGILGIPVETIPDRASWAYDQIVEGILAGKIRGLWVIATNPAHSWINQNMLRDVLSRLDFLVVQDMYHTTETAERADLVLPAAAWGEKDGTFINSERRIGLLKKVTRAPGQALSDFSIFRLIAEYWGCGAMLSRWTSPAAAFEILKQLSRGQPCDITGVTNYAMVDRRGGVQWPCPEGMTEPARERRLFADGRFYHADGRAKFVFDGPTPMPEAPNEQFPLLLLTGRGTAAQWHTQTRTAKSEVLRTLYPADVYVEINPADAGALEIKPNQHVVVESQRGKLKAKAFVTHSVQRGQVFIPMHYEAVNRLTRAHFDPHSRQPSYKNCAVRVRDVAPNDTDL